MSYKIAFFALAAADIIAIASLFIIGRRLNAADSEQRREWNTMAEERKAAKRRQIGGKSWR
jgi:hypothetical protein